MAVYPALFFPLFLSVKSLGKPKAGKEGDIHSACVRARERENKAGYTAIRCVLAGTDSSFGQKRHFCMVSTRV